MDRSCLIVTALAAAFFVPVSSRPVLAVNPDVVHRCKQATALLITDKADASAFCIDSHGVFLTNAHAVEGLKIGGTVKLVLSPGDTDQRVLTADLLRTNADADLALVRAQAPGPYTALTFGPTASLYETQDIVALGYPFGTDLSLHDGDYPAVTVSTGHITALRKKAGALEQIQVDASLNPGNSGGPVLTDDGSVVGVVQAGVAGASINFAIPANLVQPFLRDPLILCSLPHVTSGDAAQPHEFRISVVSLDHSKQPDSVELVLNAGAGPERSYEARGDAAGNFDIKAPPVVVESGRANLQLTLQDGSNSITARAADRMVTFDGHPVPLRLMKEIRPGAPATVVFADGTTRVGSLSNTGTVSAEIAGRLLPLDLTQFKTIIINAEGEGLHPIPFLIEAKAGGTRIAEVTGTIPIDGVSTAVHSPAAAVTLTGIAAAAVRELKLASNDIVFDAANRRIYASVPSAAGAMGNSVVSIDPVTGAVGQPIPVGSEPKQLAISSDGRLLYVALDGAHAVRVVDLSTRQATTQIPLGGTATVEDMAVVPNNPLAVAVAAQNPGYSPRSLGVRLYVNGRTWSDSTGAGNTIAFSDDGTRLYGYCNEITSWSFYRNVIQPGGVLKLQDTKSIFEGFNLRIKQAGGRIYTTSGVVADPETCQVVGTCAGVGAAASVCPDPLHHRVYYLAGASVLAFDSTTFVPVGRLDVPGIKGAPGSLIQWAPDQLAFRTDANQLFLVPTSLIRPRSDAPPVATDGDPRLGDQPDDAIPIIILVPDE